MIVWGFERRDVRAVWNFLRMFLRDRFLGSRLGSVWVLLNPLLMFGIYTFVFGYVFKARLPGADTTLAYAIWLIAGYGPWLAITESLNASAQSLVGNRGLIKNMAFKTECLPLAASLLGAVPLGISIAFSLVLLVVDGNVPTWHVVAILPGLVIFFLFLSALGLGLAGLTAYLRDFGVILPSLLTILLFASPIFYPIEAMPRSLQSISQWNPFHLLIEFIRQPLIFHRLPPPSQWLYMSGLTAVLSWASLTSFRKVKGVLPAAL